MCRRARASFEDPPGSRSLQGVLKAWSAPEKAVPGCGCAYRVCATRRGEGLPRRFRSLNMRASDRFLASRSNSKSAEFITTVSTLTTELGENCRQVLRHQRLCRGCAFPHLGVT